jgi:predicted MPP superfamily phosphohydrolase
MRSTSSRFILVFILLLLDFYIFQVVKSLASGASERTKIVVYGVYWSLSLLAIILVLVLPFINVDTWPKTFRTYLFAVLIGFFLCKVLASAFFLIDDLRRGVMWVVGRVYSTTGAQYATNNGISRSAFLCWLGVGVGTTLFGTFLYGFANKYNYHLRQVQLAFDNLPAAFKGLKIVQISDVHSGSFTNREAVEKGIQKIMEQEPDLILFTGDLVNDRASEMDDYHEVFARLKAPMGVYSTLGNHDYGDYVQWNTPAAKSENLERVKLVHAKMGWRLLMNEHVPLEKNGEAIALLGIENWSALRRFPKHGRLDVAYKGADQYPFKILMSHDPTHWDAQVRPEFGDIDLTLSGHTHGMQFGLENPYFKWSPVQWIYKQWAGLYEEGKQKLYVNRGFGFIGYPGRVGIMPEITVITLV